MADLHPENSARIQMFCPTCGNFLTRHTEETMKCSEDHEFTVPGLLLGQSAQAGALLNAGLLMLEQQVKLVRAIALEHSISKPDMFLKLEMNADKLDKIIAGVRNVIKDEWSNK